VTALHRELTRQTAEYKKTVKTAEREVRSAGEVNSKAQDVTDEAFNTLISTVPTTPEGLSSLLRFLQDTEESGKFWRTVSRLLKRSSIRSQPPRTVRHIYRGAFLGTKPSPG
jgi:hypothetical protein